MPPEANHLVKLDIRPLPKPKAQLKRKAERPWEHWELIFIKRNYPFHDEKWGGWSRYLPNRSITSIRQAWWEIKDDDISYPPIAPNKKRHHHKKKHESELESLQKYEERQRKRQAKMEEAARNKKRRESGY